MDFETQAKMLIKLSINRKIEMLMRE